MAITNTKKSKTAEIGEAPTKSPKDRRLANLKKPWKKGESGNPKGRIKGRKNFKTLFEEAIRKIVAEKKLPISDPEIEMVKKAVVEALKGNYSFYRDIMDRNYGRAPESLDITSGGKPLPILGGKTKYVIPRGNRDKENIGPDQED